MPEVRVMSMNDWVCAMNIQETIRLFRVGQKLLLADLVKTNKKISDLETKVKLRDKLLERLLKKVETLEGKMDKKMRKVTKEMKVAEKDVKEGKKKAAVKVLKKAEKKNMKLANYDEKVRDPMIEKCKRVKKGKK